MITYRESLKIWRNGFYSEINFWNNFIKSKGAPNFCVMFQDDSNPAKPFIYDDNSRLDVKLDKNKLNFLDVGSGPFSRCGCISKKYDLTMTCIDPLGNIYEQIKEENNIKGGNIIQSGFVELLNFQFKSNTFDVVHMSNSLDHCFDPLYGLYQLINVCKIGGKVILKHYENEADNEGYNGLHQWNLTLNNNTFSIWNKNSSFDICKILKGVVDFKLLENVEEKGYLKPYSLVEMTKLVDVSVPQKYYLYDLFSVIYEAFSFQTYVNVLDGCGENIKREYSRIIKKIQDGYYDNELLISNNIVWGAGSIGKNLIKRLKLLRCTFKVIDNYKTSNEFDLIKLEDYQSSENDTLWCTFVPSNNDKIKLTSCNCKIKFMVNENLL